MTFNDINSETMLEILSALESGSFEKDAGLWGGISEETYFRWKREIPEFKTIVERAILTYKRNLIQAANIGAIKDGKIALEILRTRFPDEWNIAKKVQLIDPEAELKRIKALIFDEEDVQEGEVVNESDKPQVPQISQGVIPQ
jgi:hypothetical protein